MEFRGYQSTYVGSLPPVDDTPLFQRYDSLYRLLAKATATNPDDRFQSADELRDQLLGVLREVVAVDSGTAAAAHSTPSSLFGSPTGAGAQLDWAELPALRVDRADPMAAWLAGVSLADGAQRLRGRSSRRPSRRSRCGSPRRAPRSTRGLPRSPQRCWTQILADNPWEWRAVWLSGLAALAQADDARRGDLVQHRLRPGAGRAGAQAGARARVRTRRRRRRRRAAVRRLRGRPTRTTSRPAAFGLARTRQSAATTRPVRSRRSTWSRRPAARTSRRGGDGPSCSPPPVAGLDDLAAAAASIDGDRHRPAGAAHRCWRRSSSAALDAVERNGDQPSTHVGARPRRPSRTSGPRPSTRTGSWRRSRPTAPSGSRLVDAANPVRPRTLV